MAENQFKCEICATMFDTREQLEDHRRTMHSQYKCEVCGATLNSRDEFETHNESMHPEKLKTR